jgi:hypothetical protein
VGVGTCRLRMLLSWPESLLLKAGENQRKFFHLFFIAHTAIRALEASVRHWRLGSSGGGACCTGCSSASTVGGKHVRSSVEAFGDGKCNGEPLLAVQVAKL